MGVNKWTRASQMLKNITIADYATGAIQQPLHETTMIFQKNYHDFDDMIEDNKMLVQLQRVYRLCLQELSVQRLQHLFLRQQTSRRTVAN